MARREKLLAIGGPLNGRRVTYTEIPEMEQGNYVIYRAGNPHSAYFPENVWLYGPNFKEWNDDDPKAIDRFPGSPVADVLRHGGSERRGQPAAIADATGTPYGEGESPCGGYVAGIDLARGPGW